ARRDGGPAGGAGAPRTDRWRSCVGHRGRSPGGGPDEAVLELRQGDPSGLPGLSVLRRGDPVARLPALDRGALASAAPIRFHPSPASPPPLSSSWSGISSGAG